MLYDPNKYDKVESDLNFAEADFTAFPSGSMPAPTGIAISEFLKQTGSAILSCATVSWTRPNDPRADWFEVQYQLDGEEWRQTEPNLTQLTSIDILNTVPGVYNFRVRAQDTSGIFPLRMGYAGKSDIKRQKQETRRCNGLYCYN